MKCHDMKIDGGMEIRLHALTSSLCYKEGSESGAGLLKLEKTYRNPLDRRQR